MMVDLCKGLFFDLYFFNYLLVMFENTKIDIILLKFFKIMLLHLLCLLICQYKAQTQSKHK